MKIIYVCSICGAEVVRLVKEGELILSGTTLCSECDNLIIFFKVEK